VWWYAGPTKNHWYKALIDGSHLVLLKRADQISTRLSTVPFKAQGKVAYSLRLRSVGANLFGAPPGLPIHPNPIPWMINTVDPALRSGQVGVRVLLQNDTIVNVTSFQATTASTAM